MTTVRKMETATLLQLPIGEDSCLVEHVKELRPLTDLILPDEPRAALDRVMAENYSAAALLARGLRPTNRLLFRGPPGCGKTVAAGGLALALGIPFAVTRLDGLICDMPSVDMTTGAEQIWRDVNADLPFVCDACNYSQLHSGPCNSCGGAVRAR